MVVQGFRSFDGAGVQSLHRSTKMNKTCLSEPITLRCNNSHWGLGFGGLRVEGLRFGVSDVGFGV